MMRCEHVFQAKGKYYSRRQGILGGELFTVIRYRECARCNKLERKILSKKRINGSADTYERQLKFSGIKPEKLLN